MVNKCLIVIVFGWLVIAAFTGCARISEPWVENPQQLKKERTRTDEANLRLHHRLMAVQTDR